MARNALPAARRKAGTDLAELVAPVAEALRSRLPRRCSGSNAASRCQTGSVSPRQKNVLPEKLATHTPNPIRSRRGIEPAQPERMAVAQDAPSDDQGQQHAIQPRHEEQSDTELQRMARPKSQQQRQQAERDRIGETRPDMSQRAREARALHPAQLIAKVSRNERLASTCPTL